MCLALQSVDDHRHHLNLITIYYTAAELATCNKVCHFCFDNTISSSNKYWCTCNKIGKLAEAKSNWLQKPPVQQLNGQYANFPLKALKFEPSEDYQDTEKTPTEILAIPQDACDFQMQQNQYSNVFSCITNKRLAELVFEPMENLLTDSLSVFESDENTIFTKDNMERIVKTMASTKEQELGSSSRDMIQSALLGQTLSQTRLARVENLKDLTEIREIVSKGFKNIDMNQLWALIISVTGLTIITLITVYRLYRRIEEMVQDNNERHILIGAAQTKKAYRNTIIKRQGPTITHQLSS